MFANSSGRPITMYGRKNRKTISRSSYIEVDTPPPAPPAKRPTDVLSVDQVTPLLARVWHSKFKDKANPARKPLSTTATATTSAAARKPPSAASKYGDVPRTPLAEKSTNVNESRPAAAEGKLFKPARISPGQKRKPSLLPKAHVRQQTTNDRISTAAEDKSARRAPLQRTAARNLRVVESSSSEFETEDDGDVGDVTVVPSVRTLRPSAATGKSRVAVVVDLTQSDSDDRDSDDDHCPSPLPAPAERAQGSTARKTIVISSDDESDAASLYSVAAESVPATPPKETVAVNRPRPRLQAHVVLPRLPPGWIAAARNPHPKKHSVTPGKKPVFSSKTAGTPSRARVPVQRKATPDARKTLRPVIPPSPSPSPSPLPARSDVLTSRPSGHAGKSLSFRKSSPASLYTSLSDAESDAPTPPPTPPPPAQVKAKVVLKVSPSSIRPAHAAKAVLAPAPTVAPAPAPKAGPPATLKAAPAPAPKKFKSPPLRTPAYLETLAHECGQDAPILFEQLMRDFPSDAVHGDLGNVGLSYRKVGEASYSEVFSIGEVVLKIIPLRDPSRQGDVEEDELPSVSDVENVTREIAMTQEMGIICDGFTKLQKSLIVQGKYPEALLQQWDAFDKARTSESIRPDAFSSEQAYAVLVLPNLGIDLESFKFRTPNAWSQASAIFWQVVIALSAAEQQCRFEHRDLHWGQIMILRLPVVRSAQAEKLSSEAFGVRATIIDLGLSRMQYSGSGPVHWTPFEDCIFDGEGDYQFDVYRMMRKHNGNSWEKFSPLTNVMWLHYLLMKMINDKHLPKTPPAGREAICGASLIEVEKLIAQSIASKKGKDKGRKPPFSSADDVAAWASAKGWI
ncbi:hypothetical protein BKA62DRAFT_636222 [Auriculariales sp. MPI-PUGE-AT-0066]|nr:hypothetical protein BKA62DRAFT_636222 [Auriculariales sp. MPI-PUGE-AT-0066]